MHVAVGNPCQTAYVTYSMYENRLNRRQFVLGGPALLLPAHSADITKAREPSFRGQQANVSEHGH